jgi:hypothetical protein
MLRKIAIIIAASVALGILSAPTDGLAGGGGGHGGGGFGGGGHFGAVSAAAVLASVDSVALA